MKRMKKRLLAMLLALMLVVGLLPVGVLAADGTEYITTTFSNNSGKRDVTVNVIGPNNEDFGTCTYSNVSGVANTITLTLTNDDYEIAYVDNNSVWNKPHSITSVSKTSNSYSFVFSSGYDLVLTVYLIEKTGDPSVSGEINRLTVSYRIYDDQVLKMLYSKKVDVDENTEIVSIKPTWKDAFGSESDKGFTGINREEDYAHLVVTSDSADRDEVQPKNISYITIAYTNGDMEDSVQIPVGELEFTREEEALSPYYNITLNNDEFHVVYFYNEEGANTGNNYALYAVRFVNHGESLGEDMPADPDYGTGNLYRFVNWEQGNYDGTGAPFFSTTEVNEDLTVFARKVSSSEHGGTEIHVLNEDDSLLNRVVELYNAAHTDAPIDIDGIDRESVKINAYDANENTTNEDYYSNGWREYQSVEYYWVCNYDAPTGFETVQNTHIGYDNIIGVNVYFTVNGGEEQSVSIPVGEYPGDVAKRYSSTDNIIELLINPAPEKPDEDDIDGDDKDPEVPNLVEKGAVKIHCTTSSEHGDATYGLINGTYNFSDVEWTGTSQDGYYYSDITITDASEYVDEYNVTTPGHELSTEQPEDRIITLIYKDGKWTVGQNEAPIVYNVTCKDEDDPGTGGDEDPDAPNAEDIIAALGDDAVKVECVNAEEQHDAKSYALDKDAFSFNIKGEGDTYWVTIGVQDKDGADTTYLTKYNIDTEPDHTLFQGLNSATTVYFAVKFDGTTNTWSPSTSIDKPLFTIYVNCKDGGGGEQPEQPDKPNPPTQDELEDIIGDESVVTVTCVNNDRKHTKDSESFGYISNGLAINDVVNTGTDDVPVYTCDITIITGSYINAFEALAGVKDAHKLADDQEEPPTFTLTWDPAGGVDGNGAWQQLPTGELPVQIEVTCDVETEIVEGPGGGVVIVPVEPEDPTDPDQTGVADLLETDDHIQYLFGYPDDSFGPDRNMTRAEAAQMFYNLLKNKNVDAEPAFDDVPDGAWYATPVNVMADLGIVDGVGDDKFEPNREITRAEFTTMAMRFADVPSGGVNIFTDVAPSDWFYSYVVNSIQYGWIEGYGDGTFRPDRLITRAEVTTIVNRMLDRQADMAFVIQNRDKLTKFTDLTTEHWAYYTIVEATNEHNYTKPAIGEDWTSLKK